MSGPTRDTARGSSLSRVQQEPAMARDHPRTSNLTLRSSTLPSVRRSASAAAHRFNVVRDGGRRLPQARNSEHARYMIRSAPPDDTDGEAGARPRGPQVPGGEPAKVCVRRMSWFPDARCVGIPGWQQGNSYRVGARRRRWVTVGARAPWPRPGCCLRTEWHCRRPPAGWGRDQHGPAAG